MPPRPKTIAIFVYEEVQTLDVTAPLDAFAAGNALQAGAYLPPVTGQGLPCHPEPARAPVIG